MASRNLFLTERGYGSDRSGNATVICGSNGQILNLRILTLPNGSIGGELIVVPLAERKSGSKSYINSEELVYEISLNRKGSGGTFRVREVDALNMSVKVMESGFITEGNGNVRFVNSEGMPNSETANTLISEKLWEAFSAAYRRSMITKPNGLSFGKIAPDGEHQERKWFKKDEKVSVQS